MRSITRMPRLIVPVTLALLLVSVALAQIGDGFEISWFTVDGRGGTSSGGPYTLNGTVGQAAAERLSVGPYTLAGVFRAGTIATPPPPPVWTGTGGQAEETVFLPVITKE
jgi:hypothetical protein